jgi:hypothetical protein
MDEIRERCGHSRHCPDAGVDPVRVEIARKYQNQDLEKPFTGATGEVVRKRSSRPDTQAMPSDPASRT